MEVVKAVSRLSKNSLNGYSEAAVVCRDATADTTSMPSSHQLAVLAEYTYNERDNADILQILDKRLNDRGKMWRHTYKSLIIVESLLFKGSRSFVRYFRQNLYVIKTLREFQYIDDLSTDQGANVREKARIICGLLYDEDKLDFERKNGYGTYDSSRAPVKSKPRQEESRSRAKSVPREVVKKPEVDRGESDLKEAMRLSQLEEDERQRKLREQADGALFGDFAQKQNDLLDLSAPSQEQTYDLAASQQAHQMELLRQQQLQAQAQAQAEYQMALQQQAYQNQLASEQAYAQQIAMQQQYAQQQQQEQYYALQQQAQLAYQQQMQAQLQQPQPLAAQPTGANNPFAAFAPTPQPPPPLPTSTSSTPTPAPNSLAQYQASQAAQAPSGRHAELERMLAGGSGIDTFGNVGNLRLGANPTGHAFSS